MANLDDNDAPAEMSELDLSEDAAIDGEDVQENLGVREGSVVQPNPDEEAQSDPDDEAAGPGGGGEASQGGGSSQAGADEPDQSGIHRFKRRTTARGQCAGAGRRVG